MDAVDVEHITKIMGNFELTYRSNHCYFGHTHTPSSGFMYIKNMLLSMEKITYIRFWNSVLHCDKLIVLGEYQTEPELKALLTLNGAKGIYEMPNSHDHELTFILVIDLNTCTVVATEVLLSDCGDVRCYGICMDSKDDTIVVSGSCYTNGTIMTQKNNLYTVDSGICALVAVLDIQSAGWTMVQTLAEYSVIPDLVQMNGVIYGSASTWMLMCDSSSECECCVTDYRVISVYPQIATSRILESSPVGQYLTTLGDRLYYVTTHCDPPRSNIYRSDSADPLQFELLDSIPYRTHDIRAIKSVIEILMDRPAGPAGAAVQYYLATITDDGLTKCSPLEQHDQYYKTKVQQEKRAKRSVRVSLTFG